MAVAGDILRGKRRKGGIVLDQGQRGAWYACQERQARSADTGAQIHDMVARVRVGRGGKQNRIVPDAVSAPLLMQTQSAAQDGIVGSLGFCAGGQRP